MKDDMRFDGRQEAADDWGGPHDVCRSYFLQGWDDWRNRRVHRPPSGMAEAAGYNSGWIEARQNYPRNAAKEPA